MAKVIGADPEYTFTYSTEDYSTKGPLTFFARLSQNRSA
jgi:hypothetical protein